MKPNPTGYGAKDAKLTRDLDAARSKEAADKRAKDEGLRDAKDARGWLRDRSR